MTMVDAFCQLVLPSQPLQPIVALILRSRSSSSLQTCLISLLLVPVMSLISSMASFSSERRRSISSFGEGIGADARGVAGRETTMMSVVVRSVRVYIQPSAMLTCGSYRRRGRGRALHGTWTALRLVLARCDLIAPLAEPRWLIAWNARKLLRDTRIQTNAYIFEMLQ